MLPCSSCLYNPLTDCPFVTCLLELCSHVGAAHEITKMNNELVRNPLKSTFLITPKFCHNR